jgi:asparagine synthetase B (glutamine-hydrolysing)
MCGIAGVYLLDGSLNVNLDSMLDTMLDEIEHRGGDATGFVALSDEGVVEWQKASCGARDFSKGRRAVPKGTRTILAHTRWATQGLPAFMENNHPLKRGSFFVIHNGHVSNDHKLFELAGRERFGQVDSEAVPARLASLGKLAALGQVMSEIEGGAAIAAVDEKHPKDLALARGYQSPLFVLQTKKIVVFASTQGAVKQMYESHVGKLPKRAKIEAVKQGTLLVWKDGKLKRSNFKPYSPPKVTYKPQTVLPWKEIEGFTPQSISQFTGWSSWDKADEDFNECDSCGVEKSWKSFEYVEDDEGFTEALCDMCYEGFLRRSGDSIPGVYEEVAPTMAEVNEAILQQFLAKNPEGS